MLIFMTYGMDSGDGVKADPGSWKGSIGPLPKTLFFEYKTVNELTAFFSAPSGGIDKESLGDSCHAGSPTGGHGESEQAFAQAAQGFRTAPAFSATPSASEIAISRFGEALSQGGPEHAGVLAKPKSRKDCITLVPKERLALWQTPSKGKMWVGFYRMWIGFDPLFFQIAPRSQTDDDPQERLFLECCMETLQGFARIYPPGPRVPISGTGMAGNVGVFVGVMYGGCGCSVGAQSSWKGRSVSSQWQCRPSIANRSPIFAISWSEHGCGHHVLLLFDEPFIWPVFSASAAGQLCEAAVAGQVRMSPFIPINDVALTRGEFLWGGRDDVKVRRRGRWLRPR